MPKRPRLSRTIGTNTNGSENIPKPPSRLDFERKRPEATPDPNQRLLPNSTMRLTDREALDHLDRKAAPDPDPGPATQSIVAMLCVATKTAFAIRFERNGHLKWRMTDTFLLGQTKGTPVGKLQAVPVDQMDFGGALCPACGARCRPIFCGGCKQFVCDGGVSLLPSSEEFHRCVCGAMGTLKPTLRTISTANGADVREPSGATPISAPLLLRFRRE